MRQDVACQRPAPSCILGTLHPAAPRSAIHCSRPPGATPSLGRHPAGMQGMFRQGMDDPRIPLLLTHQSGHRLGPSRQVHVQNGSPLATVLPADPSSCGEGWPGARRRPSTRRSAGSAQPLSVAPGQLSRAWLLCSACINGNKACCLRVDTLAMPERSEITVSCRRQLNPREGPPAVRPVQYRHCSVFRGLRRSSEEFRGCSWVCVGCRVRRSGNWTVWCNTRWVQIASNMQCGVIRIGPDWRRCCVTPVRHSHHVTQQTQPDYETWRCSCS